MFILFFLNVFGLIGLIGLFLLNQPNDNINNDIHTINL